VGQKESGEDKKRKWRSIEVGRQGEVITTRILNDGPKLLQSIISEPVPMLTLEVRFRKAAEEFVDA